MSDRLTSYERMLLETQREADALTEPPVVLRIDKAQFVSGGVPYEFERVK